MNIKIILVYYIILVFYIIIIINNYPAKNIIYKLKNKKVILIGNGPSALKNKKNIDDIYDVIIRFNDPKIEQFKEYVGTRTDIICTGGHYSQHNNIPNIVFLSDYHVCLYPFAPIGLLTPYSKKKTFTCDFTNKSFIYTSSKIKKDLGLGLLKQPSTGISMIHFLKENNINFDITGFDTLTSEISMYTHYDKSKTFFLFDSTHDWKKEYVYFNN